MDHRAHDPDDGGARGRSAGDHRNTRELGTPAGVAQAEAAQIAEQLEALVARQRSARSAAVAPEETVRGLREGPRHSGRLLGNLLVTRGFIVQSELDYALTVQSQRGGLLGQILVDLGLIGEQTLVDLLAEQLRMRVVDLSRIELDATLRTLVPEHDARRLRAVPIRRRRERIDIAVADPTDGDAARWIAQQVHAPVRLLLTTKSDLDAALDRLYGHPRLES